MRHCETVETLVSGDPESVRPVTPSGQCVHQGDRERRENQGNLERRENQGDIERRENQGDIERRDDLSQTIRR